MLNELYSMYKGLENIGESPEIKHNDIQSPGMGTTFRVLLDCDGNVSRVELMTKDQIKDTWSLGNGYKNHFPAVKLVTPLIPDAHSSYKDWKENNKNPNEKSYRELIQNLTDNKSTGLLNTKCWPNYRNKIIERKDQLEVMRGGENECVYRLFERYSKSPTGVSILEQVSELMIKKALEDADKFTLKAISDALFGGDVDNKGNVKDGKRVTFLLDYLPKEDVDIHASSRTWVPSISKALFESGNHEYSKKSICAFTGSEDEVVVGTFSKEKLSVVGNTVIFAKNAGTSGPTVRRYGKSGADSYLIGKDLSQKLAASISFLSSDKLKGKTWSKIPSSTGSSPSLLLAYCKDNLNLSVTQLITGDSEIEDFDDYQDATQTVLDLFDRSNCTPDAAVEIAEIIVLDKANRKINYSTTSTLENVRLAAQEWVSGGNNTPNFKLRAQVAKNKKLYSPWPLSPSSCVEVSRNVFKKEGVTVKEVMLNKNGRKVKPPPSIGFPDIMRLFFSKGDIATQLAKRCLMKLSIQYEPLLSHCALSKVYSVLPKKVQDKKPKFKTNPKNNTQALNAVTLLAVLLYKIGRNKEVYMNGFAYQLGQLCSAIDELHIGYCKSVRGGQIPNTLIGSLTYGMALQNPTKALAQLAPRIRPYETWAKKELTKSKDKFSDDKAIKAGIFAYKWLSGQSEKLSSHFSENDEKSNDSYKAELMLGYLAGRPFEKTNSQLNSKESQGEK